ncbi:MAG: hypothetical protein DCC49_10955 [Acidobacteria bacterium]|nr:MAG: hypothetical protein DCC49_10955 [Acidobacteriota bacterium]
MTPKPLVVLAYVAWLLGVVALAGGIFWFLRADLDEEGRRRGTAPVAVITLAALLLLFGTAAFFARSGEVADPESASYSPTNDDLTTTLSPIPTAPPAPAQASPTADPGGDQLPPVEIGFEEIGSVAIGGSKSKIEATFGKPSAVVETVADDGKPVEAYTYEGKRQFMIYVRDSKVRSYAVLSPGFVTFSGVAVGDSYDKVDTTYGAKLKTISDDVYSLSGPQSTSMRLHFESGKVSRIEGGHLG